MQEKTVSYGTTYKVKIEYSTKSIIMAICDEIREGFVLMDHGLKVLPKINATGKIVFEPGGPNNGHWEFYHEPKPEQCPTPSGCIKKCIGFCQ